MKKDIASSFNKNIEIIDRFRYYRRTYAFRPSAGLFEQLRLAKMVDNKLGKYDRSLWKWVQKESEEIGKPIELVKSDKNYNFLFYIFFAFMFCTVGAATFLRVYSPSEAMNVLIISFVGLFLLFPAIIFKIVLPRSKRSIQRSFEQKELVQELVNSAVEFFKKEDIDPGEYPLKLKFNDYCGLSYVGKSRLRKEYSAYLDLEASIPLQSTEEDVDKISSRTNFVFIVGIVIIAVVTVFIMFMVK